MSGKIKRKSNIYSYTAVEVASSRLIPMRIIFLNHSCKTALRSHRYPEQSENMFLPQCFIAIAAQVSNSQIIHHYQDKIGLAAFLKRHAAHLHEQQQQHRGRQACGLHVVRADTPKKKSYQMLIHLQFIDPLIND